MKSPATAETMAETIVDLFRRKGASLYGGESVTQLEHALQAAHLGEQTGATPASIVAALLHDVGHLLHDLPDNAPDDGIDDVHERLGDAWLRESFESAVCDPVRLHVAAKRYLCAVDPEYQAGLSPASVQSLHLQGGPYNYREAREFEAEPYFKECIELRRWDDLAKVPGLETPTLTHFLTYLPACMLHADPVPVA